MATRIKAAHRETPAQRRKIGKVMREFNGGRLKMGRSGNSVHDPKQAIAIALREAGVSRPGRDTHRND